MTKELPDFSAIKDEVLKDDPLLHHRKTLAQQVVLQEQVLIRSFCGVELIAFNPSLLSVNKFMDGSREYYYAGRKFLLLHPPIFDTVYEDSKYIMKINQTYQVIKEDEEQGI